MLDNDTNLRGDAIKAALVTPSALAEVFELRPGGSFDYEHDGGETSTDFFTYTANTIDGVSNQATVSCSVTPVSDAPVIMLNRSSSANISFGVPYVEEGATALDAEDGDISADIVVGGDVVTTAVPGTYVLTYNVLDSDGAAADEVTRTLHVADPAPTGTAASCTTVWRWWWNAWAGRSRGRLPDHAVQETNNDSRFRLLKLRRFRPQILFPDPPPISGWNQANPDRSGA